MSEETVIVESTGRRLSAIWAVPVVALLLGIWLAINAYLSQGPTITVRFATAEGISAEKTLVKIKSVTIGVVTEVRLAADLSGVVVTAELDPQAKSLLREDSEFWVTKAEVRGAAISGLGTLLSGAYLEISSGVGAVTDRRDFKGLDRRPVSPHGTPVKRLGLSSESSGSVGGCSPIL